MDVVTAFSSDDRRLFPNVTTTPVALGAWHRIEWYTKYSTTATSHDGITKWWMDGVLQGLWTDLQMPGNSPGFDQFEFAPTWGGVGNPPKTETDFFWYDHAHLSKAP